MSEIIVEELPYFQDISPALQEPLKALAKAKKNGQAQPAEPIKPQVIKDTMLETLATQMKTQTKDIEALDAAFERARLAMDKVDKAGYKDKDGKPVPKFEPRWAAIQKSWREFVVESRKSAVETASYIHEFLTVIIPAIEANKLQKAKDLLKKFIARKNPHAKPPAGQGKVKLAPHETDMYAMDQELSQDAENIRKAVRTFGEDIIQFSLDQRTPLDKPLSEQQLRVDKCLNAMKELDAVIKTIMTLTHKEDERMTAAAMSSFIWFGSLSMFPMTILTVMGLRMNLGSITKIIYALNTLPDKRKALDQAQTEMSALRAKDTNNKIQNALRHQMSSDVRKLVARLDVYRLIWSGVARQAVLHSEALDNAQDSASMFGLKARLEVTKTCLQLVFEALNVYSTEIGKSAAFKPKA